MNGQSSTTVRERLAVFLAANPNAAQWLRQDDIVSAIGASRSRIGQLLPRRKPVRRSAALALARFLEQHPEAMLTRPRGGMTIKAIAAEIGFRPGVVGRAWRQLELPDRRLLKLTRNIPSLYRTGRRMGGAPPRSRS